MTTGATACVARVQRGDILPVTIAHPPVDAPGGDVTCGFPRHRGGPMQCADTAGLAKILPDIRAFAQERCTGGRRRCRLAWSRAAPTLPA